MKKFTKLFLSCAAVAAVTAAVATSAMAAGEITGGVTGDVTVPETGAVTITNLSVGETPDANTQVTFLVFKGTLDTDISADSVKGIDQGTAVQPTNNGLKSDVTVPESGQETYTVKVGYYKDGTFAVKSGTFKLGTALGEDFVLGEVDGDTTSISTNDATCVLKAGLGGSKGIGDANKEVTLTQDLVVDGLDTIATGVTIKLGEVDGDRTSVSTNDATCVLKKGLGGSKGIGYAGQTITGTAVAE